jgi:tetratricopeptide (TPR) repeat protein
MSEFPSLLVQARAAAVDRRFDEAAGLAQRVLSAQPRCLPALRLLAWAQLELDDDRAVTTFQFCARLDPEDPLAEVGQAIWFEQHQQRARAAESWARAWELAPENQPIRRALVRLTGDLPESPLADGIGLLRAGRFDEAAEVLRQIVDPNRPAALLALTDAMWALGAPQQAYRLAANLHTRAPECIKAALYVAASEEAAGHTLRGRELLARAEQADPSLELFGATARQLNLPSLNEPFRASRPALASAW